MISISSSKTTQRKKQRAFILLPVILTLTILAAVAYLLSREGAINAGNVIREHQQDSALYVAQAGYNHAVWQLNRQNCTGYADIPDTTLGDHSYLAEFTDTTGTVLTAGSPANIKVVGTLANGASYTLSRDREKIYYPPTTMTLQLGTDPGKDTMIDSFYNLRNHGDYKMGVSSDPGWSRHQLIQFDLSSIPTEVSIVSAQLELQQISTNSTQINAKVSVYREKQSWVEGTQSGGGLADGATWDTADGSLVWDDGSGGSYNSTSIASTEITGDNVLRFWDISTLVQGWHNGLYANNGLLLKGSGTVNVEFASKEDSTAADRPKLIIIYNCECGKSCAPEAPLIPIAHWKLDETTGITAVDSIGGHDGTLINAPSWTTGNVDGGLDFDGVDDLVDTGSNVGLDDLFAGGATMTAWINPGSWGEGGFGRIADKADALGTNRNGWAFELYSSPRALLFQYGFSGAIGNWYTPTDSITLNTWQHVAVVYDNSSDLNDPLIYIGGVLQTLTELDTPSGTASSDVTVNLTIGNYAVDLSRTFDGILDDIRIYDTMLDAAEITALASAVVTPPSDCDGNFRDEFNDVSYSNNNGSLTWASDWLQINESGETDPPTEGDEVVDSDDPTMSNQLRVQDNDGDGEGVMRTADLTGASTATLSFDYRREALDSTTDYVSVQIASMATGGVWVEIDRFEGAATDSSYTSINYDITSYIASDTTLRFISSATLGFKDAVWFDNVEIQCSP